MPYIEVSAKNNINLKRLFGLVTHLALKRAMESGNINIQEKKIPKKKKCNIM